MTVRQPSTAPEWALARPRLLAALEGATSPLIVLRAGAGYGKTVLASQWAASRPRTCWFDLGGRALAPDGWAALPGDLVLDGYLPGAPALDAAIAALVESCPDGRRVVLLSRAEPGLDVGRRRIEGTVVELGAFDLAFNGDETLELLRLTTGSGCDDAQLDALMSRTLGWPAAVRLALQGMPSAGDGGTFTPITGATGPLADYLETEIWRPLNADQREFALATSLLDEFQPEWCDGISECGGGARMVRELRSADTWLLPPRQVGAGYRHHPLVREFFQAHLAEQPSRRRDLETRSARTLSGNQRGIEAIELALRAEDWELAVECLRRGADRAFREGQGERLRHCLGRFPGSYRDRPVLLRVEGYLSWAAGDLEVALVKALRAAEVEDVDLQADALILQAAVYYAVGNFGDELAALQRAIDLGPGDSHILGKAWFGLGSLHYRAGRIGEAEAALQRAVALTHEGEPAHAAVLSVLALLPLARGTPRAALPGLTRAVAGNRKVGNRRGEAHACYHLAIALNQSGMHQRALDTLAEAERLARELGLAHLAALVARENADTHRDMQTGESPQRYRQAIAELEALGASAGLLHAYHGLAVHLRRQNEPEAACRAATRALAHADSGDPAFVTLVRLHLALLSDDNEAVRSGCAEMREHQHRYYRALGLLYAAAGDRSAARQLARETMELIHDEGFEHLLREEQALAASWSGPASRGSSATTDTRRERFELYLLGDLRLREAKGETLKIRPQALKLLTFLALRRGATVDPAQLIDALWPERGSEMRPTMQTLIWLLRRTLHERLVVTHNSGYAFDPDGLVWVDAEEFGRSLREERFEECISLYRGELLPGVEWADLERRQFENRFLHVLEGLADDRCAAGRSDEGIELYERIVAIDPLAEEAYRKLIACHRKAGREDAAQRLRREFDYRLERELRVSAD